MSFEHYLISSFESNQDPVAASKMEAYLKNKFVLYGISTPIRKQICKEAYNEFGIPENSVAIAKYLFSQPNRECHYSGQELLMKGKRQWQEHHIDDFEWFITTNSWWDTVDHLASNVVGTYFQKWPENTDEIVRRWNRSGNVWLVRTSIIFQLKYKDKVDTQLLADCIKPHTEDKEFFIKKAIGWALRQYSRFNPEWVKLFVEQNDLQPLSKKEALRLL